MSEKPVLEDYRDFVPEDAPCCVISVTGHKERDLSFVELSLFQIEGHHQPNRWERLKMAWKHPRPFLEFYTPETLDDLIASLQKARAAIWPEESA